MEYSKERYRELEANLARVRGAIVDAAQDISAVRSKDSPLPQLTVVTKFFPAHDVAALYDLGIRNVGENRAQEAAEKSEQLRSYTGDSDPLRWAYIGQLQTNKAKSAVKYAAEIHSVDRVSLVATIAKAYQLQIARFENGEASAPFAHRFGGLDCLIQVNLDETVSASAGHGSEGKRGGADKSSVLQLAEQLELCAGLRCAGVMAVAPLGVDPNRAFERLYQLSQKLVEIFPHANRISAGMSGDMASAIRWGSTDVRIGSQIMGRRPLVD